MNYATRLSDTQIAIFLFHGVIQRQRHAVRNYTRKHIEKDYFAQIVRALKAAGSPVSMEQIRAHHEQREPLPPRAFAITFDDGFENNLSVAAPVLADEGVPATFYVTTDFIDRNRMGWIDRIEFAVEQRTQGRLRLPWGERTFDGDEQRCALLTEIRREAKRDRHADVDALATDVQTQLGMEPVWSSDDPLDRKLTWNETSALNAGPGFLVAGHSHTHRILEYLDDAELAGELDSSLGLLERRAGIRNVHYSYPEGLSFCYSARVIDALKRRGVRCCPSAEDGLNTGATDLFELRRIMVV